MTLKSWLRLVQGLIVLVLALGLGGYILYTCRSREAERQPEVTPQEIQMEITERLRLITQRITYRRQIYIRDGAYSAEGVADLAAYSKFDLERLKVQRGPGDTIYISLPEPQVELGQTPGGSHSVKYYEYSQGLWGTRRRATSDRRAVKRLDDSIMSRAWREIQADPQLVPQSKVEARERLQSLVRALYPQQHIIVTEELRLPGVETRTNIAPQ